jgi:hypothetical protein
MRVAHLLPENPWRACAGGTEMQQTCESCGNSYDKAFTVVMDDVSHVFDSFECAIHTLAPRCAHCECRIVGHGIEADGSFFCCAHCASRKGIREAVDRADSPVTGSA